MAGSRQSLTIGAQVGYGLLGIAVWLVLWLVVTSAGPYAENEAFPDPASVGSAAVEQILNREFWDALWATLAMAGMGLILAIVVGVPLGLALGMSAIVRKLLQPTVEILKPIPGIVILPLLLLIFGPTSTMGLLLVFIGCVWAILIQTYTGVLSTDPVARLAARGMLLGRWLTLRRVVLPSATPSIITGIRIATAASLVLAIGAGLIGGAPGIGQLLFLYQSFGSGANVFGLIILVGLIGLAINILLSVLERRAVPWSIRSEVVG